MSNVTFNSVSIRLLGLLYIEQNYSDELTEKITTTDYQIKRLQKVGLINWDKNEIPEHMLGFAKAAAAIVAKERMNELVQKMLTATEERLKGSGKFLVPTYDGLINVWKEEDVPEDIEQMDDMYWEYVGIALSGSESNIFPDGMADVRYELFDLERKDVALLDTALKYLEHFVAKWQATKTFCRCSIRKAEDYAVLTVYEYIGEPATIIEEEIDRVFPAMPDDAKALLIDSVLDDTMMFQSILEEAYATKVFSFKDEKVSAETILAAIPRLVQKVGENADEQEKGIRTMTKYHMARYKQL